MPGCISIILVMAAGGSALTASHLEKRQVTKGSCPFRSASRGGAQIKSGRRANARPDEWWKSKANTIPCRSRLAGDSGGSVNVCIGWTDVIVGTPPAASRLLQGMRKHPKLVGPPQCRSTRTTDEPGRLSGRLGGCGGSRPLERLSGGSAQWATRHGCRVSRARPGMADRGGPTEQDRSEGMPSLGEAPNERGKSAWLLGASPSDSP